MLQVKGTVTSNLKHFPKTTQIYLLDAPCYYLLLKVTSNTKS